MPSITVQTLTLCIQSVAAEIRQLKADRDSADGRAQADIDEILLAYSLAGESAAERSSTTAGAPYPRWSIFTAV